MSHLDIRHFQQLIERTLAQLDVPDANWAFVKAMSFDQPARPDAAHDGILVVWRADQRVMDFYDENGGLLKTVRLDQEKHSTKAA